MFDLFSPARRRSVLFRSGPQARLRVERLETRAAPSALDDPLIEPPLSDPDADASGAILDTDVEAAVEEGSDDIAMEPSGDPSGEDAVLEPSAEPDPGVDEVFIGYDDSAIPPGDGETEGDFLPEGAIAAMVPPPGAATPEITEFSCFEGVDSYFTFSGTVTGDLTDMDVVLDGTLISLQNVTTPVSQNGDFSYTVQLSGTMDDEGTATAVATDAAGNSSEEMSIIVHQSGVS